MLAFLFLTDIQIVEGVTAGMFFLLVLPVLLKDFGPTPYVAFLTWVFTWFFRRIVVNAYVDFKGYHPLKKYTT